MQLEVAVGIDLRFFEYRFLLIARCSREIGAITSVILFTETLMTSIHIDSLWIMGIKGDHGRPQYSVLPPYSSSDYLEKP